MCGRVVSPGSLLSLRVDLLQLCVQQCLFGDSVIGRDLLTHCGMFQLFGRVLRVFGAARQNVVLGDVAGSPGGVQSLVEERAPPSFQKVGSFEHAGRGEVLERMDAHCNFMWERLGVSHCCSLYLEKTGEFAEWCTRKRIDESFKTAWCLLALAMACIVENKDLHLLQLMFGDLAMSGCAWTFPRERKRHKMVPDVELIILTAQVMKWIVATILDVLKREREEKGSNATVMLL